MGRLIMVITIPAIGLALILTVLTPVAASAYSMVAIIETATQGTLDCGNQTRGLEGTEILYGLSDEATVQGV